MIGRAGLVLLLTVAFCAVASAQILTETEARAWCDTGVLAPVEGIWEYPSDDVRVVIKSDSSEPGTFAISILDTPDCRLQPGDVIGRLYPTADSRQYRLEQKTRVDPFGLIHPKDCAASLSADGESLNVKSPKVKLKIMPYTLLPRFWRIIRVSEKNPADDLPVGLVKVYPGYDRNGSLRRKPRIL